MAASWRLIRPSRTAGCVNTPRWRDTWGTCATYVRNRWCSANGTKGPRWNNAWGTLDPSVVRACCKCGKQPSKATVTSASIRRTHMHRTRIPASSEQDSHLFPFFCACTTKNLDTARTGPPTVPTLSGVTASTCAAVSTDSPMPPPCATATLRAGGVRDASPVHLNCCYCCCFRCRSP